MEANTVTFSGNYDNFSRDKLSIPPLGRQLPGNDYPDVRFEVLAGDSARIRLDRDGSHWR